MPPTAPRFVPPTPSLKGGHDNLKLGNLSFVHAAHHGRLYGAATHARPGAGVPTRQRDSISVMKSPRLRTETLLYINALNLSLGHPML